MALNRGVGEVQQVGGVVVVRRRLAEIIKTGPDKFAGDERILILALELRVRRVAPRRRGQVVGAHLEIGAAQFLVIADRKEILAARTDAGGGLAAEQRQAWVVGPEFGVIQRLVVVAEDVHDLLKAVVPAATVCSAMVTGRVGSSSWTMPASCLAGFPAIGVVLLADLVADAPEDDAGMIAVAADQARKSFSCQSGKSR